MISKNKSITPFLVGHVFSIILNFLCCVVLLGQGNNYQYDQQGRLITDLSEEISSITWNNLGLVSTVSREASSQLPDLAFAYDQNGSRTMKLVMPRDGNGLEAEYTWKYYYYSYDAQGNMIAIYVREYTQVGPTEFQEHWSISEQILLGKVGRVGLHQNNQSLLVKAFEANIDGNGRFVNVVDKGYLTDPLDGDKSAYRGQKSFELPNHTEDVAVVVNDRRVTSSDEMNTFVQMATHYFPFGMVMPERKYKNADYRFGFGGKEKDNDLKGDENSYDFGGRSIYDPRIARFTSIDPMWRKFSEVSPYAFAFNNPIIIIDKDGNEGFDFRLKDWINNDSSPYEKFIAGFVDAGIDAGMGVVELIQLLPISAEGVSNYWEFQKAMASMMWKIAWDAEYAEGLYNDMMNSIGEDMKNLDGDGDEVAYTRGRYTFSLVTLAGGAAISVAGKGAQSARLAGKLTKAVTPDAKVPKVQVAPTAGSVVARSACFLGDTEVLTYGGKFVYIKDISVEEELYKLSEEEREMLKKEENDVVELVLEGVTYLIVCDQFFIVDGEWKMAKDLKVGDEILKRDGTTTPIISIQIIPRLKLKKATLENTRAHVER